MRRTLSRWPLLGATVVLMTALAAAAWVAPSPPSANVRRYAGFVAETELQVRDSMGSATTACPDLDYVIGSEFHSADADEASVVYYTGTVAANASMILKVTFRRV